MKVLEVGLARLLRREIGRLRSDVTLSAARTPPRIDRFYIENWSFGLDLYILGKTVGAVPGRRGAM